MSSVGASAAPWGQSLSADLERLIASPPVSLGNSASAAIFHAARCFNAAYPTYTEWSQAPQISKSAWDAVVIKCIAAGRRLTRYSRASWAVLFLYISTPI
jgi:hypothetical protein